MYFSLILILLPVHVCGCVLFFISVTSIPDVYSVRSAAVTAAAAAAAAKALQSCPTLCDPIDSSPPGSPVPGILQARALE